MDDPELHFDFERSLHGVGAAKPLLRSKKDALPKVPELPSSAIGQQPGNYKKNFRQGLCMKGDNCGFLHQLDPQRMPVCRAVLKYGVCKEPDCLFKHSLDDVKECNMFKLGFCIYGNNCRYKHTKLPGPPPDPDLLEAAKPREYRNINIVVNEVNPNIATGDLRPHKRPKLGGVEVANRPPDGAGAMHPERMANVRDPAMFAGAPPDLKPIVKFDPPPPPPGPPPIARSHFQQGTDATRLNHRLSPGYS